MQGFSTEQEEFWSSDFGDEYISRNGSADLLASKTIMWSRMLRSARGLHSVCELGCNIGLNLRAIKSIAPSVELTGYEINEKAAEAARMAGVADIHCGTIVHEIASEQFDLIFTAGVLIHINPDFLHGVYNNLFRLSKKYVLVCEYYNPTPVSLSYRGHSDRLFKRDFAGELIDKYRMNLVDYGFFYHRDMFAPQDDLSWFLLEKA